VEFNNANLHVYHRAWKGTGWMTSKSGLCDVLSPYFYLIFFFF